MLLCVAWRRAARFEEGRDLVMTETLTVQELSRLCQEETGRYLRREPYAERFCLELFRRAIVQHDETAWSSVYSQYTGAVRQWLGLPPDEADEGIAATFERFWRAINGEKFQRFGSLSAVLQYLKMCAQTVRIDRMRATRSIGREEPLDDSERGLPSGENVEESTAARVDAVSFWRAVQDALDDERERKVIYLSYVIGLTPRAICTRHANEFPDVAEVYRLKRNALDRLRRTPEIKTLR